MANHKSAAKRARQNVGRNLRNKSYLSMVKTSIKKFKTAVTQPAENNQEKLHSLFQEAQSLLQKAVTKGMLHKNNAARRISRLSRSIKTTA